MKPNVEIFPEASWPTGDCVPIAVIGRSVAELEAELGARFIPERDDLGDFLQCGLRLPSGRLLLLMRYTESADGGVEAHFDQGDNFAEAVDELLDTLEVSLGDLTWLSPRVHDRGAA